MLGREWHGIAWKCLHAASKPAVGLAIEVSWPALY